MARVSELFVRALKKAGVNHVFGIPSIHNIGLYDALREHPSIKHTLCRHESSATHMADGYARAGKGVGVVITSTGPGASYMAAPLLEAWGNLSPVLAITTNIATKKIGRGTGTLHELKDQDLIFKNTTKEQFCLRTGDDVHTMVPKAVQTALSGRPGPVYCEVPTDLWDQDVPRDGEALPSQAPPQSPEQGDGDLDQAAKLLCEAERPVIIAGTDAIRAGIGKEIMAISEAIQAPLVTNAEGKGLIPEDHDLAFGNAARRGVVREMITSSTVALAIGTRLRSVDYHRRGVSLPRLIHVDWNDTWINKNYPAEMSFMGDIRTIARRLSEMVISRASGSGNRGKQVSAMRDETRDERKTIAKNCREIGYLDTLRQVIPRDGSLVIDNTMLGYWAEYFYPSFMPGGLVTAKGSSIIGFSFPAAIGLKIACPERSVVAVIGDGGFLYGAQEMATCRRHGIGFPVIVVNDGAYGMIDLLQRQIYGRGPFETNLMNPDLPAFAASFGIGAERVDTPQGLEQALRSALASKKMRVIELAAAFSENPFAKY
ncbi:MAG: thiamine pyrophosphate-binding protein [Desulfobacteraceae bacterium]|nr:thiamine pyrophosphate-binding protein [Desulfobacteraceae bacterium]